MRWIRSINELGGEEVIWYLRSDKADNLVSLGLWEYISKPRIRYRLRRYTMVINKENTKVWS